MKLLLLAVVCLAALVAAEEFYDSKYDKIDIDAVLNNKRLLDNYCKCFLNSDNKGCTEDAIFVKDRINESLRNECTKCSDKQKEIIKKCIVGVQDKNPKCWDDLKKKYDPENQYAQKYADRAKAEGVTV